MRQRHGDTERKRDREVKTQRRIEHIENWRYGYMEGYRPRPVGRQEIKSYEDRRIDRFTRRVTIRRTHTHTTTFEDREQVE